MMNQYLFLFQCIYSTIHGFTLRFIGHVKSYCNSRNNPHAGLVFGYTQTSFVRRMDSGMVDKIMARYREKDLMPSQRSASISTTLLLQLRGSKAGQGQFIARPSWRNMVTGDAGTVAALGAFLRLQKATGSPFAQGQEKI